MHTTLNTVTFKKQEGVIKFRKFTVNLQTWWRLNIMKSKHQEIVLSNWRSTVWNKSAICRCFWTTEICSQLRHLVPANVPAKMNVAQMPIFRYIHHAFIPRYWLMCLKGCLCRKLYNVVLTRKGPSSRLLGSSFIKRI